ncbi:hypothetical protein PENTCL1PPCAC_16350, partial [Pristionchus entomophagus]
AATPAKRPRIDGEEEEEDGGNHIAHEEVNQVEVQAANQDLSNCNDDPTYDAGLIIGDDLEMVIPPPGVGDRETNETRRTQPSIGRENEENNRGMETDSQRDSVSTAGTTQRTASNEERMTCRKCDNPIIALDQYLRKHAFNHCKQRPFECPQCDFNHHEKRKVKRHMRDEHHIYNGVPDIEDNPLLLAKWQVVREQCFPDYDWPTNTVGQSRTILTCSVCKKRVKKNLIYDHIVRHHPKGLDYKRPEKEMKRFFPDCSFQRSKMTEIRIRSIHVPRMNRKLPRIGTKRIRLGVRMSQILISRWSQKSLNKSQRMEIHKKWSDIGRNMSDLLFIDYCSCGHSLPFVLVLFYNYFVT